MKKRFVLDIESSGLYTDSFPIEVAWADIDTHRGDTMLIKPATGWDYMDSLAVELHGLTLSALDRSGVSVEEAVTRLESELATAKVFSDAVEWDSIWLDSLYTAAGRTRTWVLESIDPESVSMKDCLRLHRALVDADELARAIKDTDPESTS